MRCRRALALARLAALAHRTDATGGLPAEHDAVADRQAGDAVADGLDRARPLVPEQHRIRVMPAVLLDHVQIGVTDAGRVDPNEHLGRAGRFDADLLERDRVAR